jgi:hypothetical protein
MPLVSDPGLAEHPAVPADTVRGPMQHLSGEALPMSGYRGPNRAAWAAGATGVTLHA